MPTILGGRYQIHISLTSHPSPLLRPPTTKTSKEAAQAGSRRAFSNLFEEDSLTSDILQRSLLKSPPSSTLAQPSASPAASQFLDPRLGPIQLDFIDQEEMAGSPSLQEQTASSSRLAGTPRVSSSTHLTPHSAASSTWKARFIQSSSFPVEGEGGQTTEVLFGIVHMFREGQGKMMGEEGEEPQPEIALDDDSGTLLAVMGLPIQMTAAEFLGWVEPAKDSIAKIRMIREANASRCTVLMQFRDASDAEEFYKQYCDQPIPYFASASAGRAAPSTSPNLPVTPSAAQIVYVTQVTVSTSGQLPYAYPQLANSDPWPLPVVSTSSREGEAGSSSVVSSTDTTPATRLALSLAQELPTCPVCLERMDSSVTGLMTVSCQHTFHCECLSRWGDARCPVCRYSQNRAASRGASVFGGMRSANGGGAGREDVNGDEDATHCTLCGTTDDLWVCLICATVGCGRYKKGCAKKHFVEAGHIYSLELETSRVWDYVNDGYIHRLIQNRADGKLVELPSSSQSTPVRHRRGHRGVSQEAGTSGRRSLGAPENAEEEFEEEEEDELDDPKKSGGKLGSTDEKLEAISLEYQYLLLSQLESQRAYYEEQVRRLQHDLDEVRSSVAREQASGPLLAAREAHFEKERQDWLSQRAALEERQVRLNARLERAIESGTKLSRELHSERSLGRGLMTRLESQQADLERGKVQSEELRRTVQDQGEQLRDLMFALSATDKIRQVGEEAHGADLIVRGGARAPSSKKQLVAKSDEASQRSQGVRTKQEKEEEEDKEVPTPATGGEETTLAKQKKNKKKKAKGKSKSQTPAPASAPAPAQGQTQTQTQAQAQTLGISSSSSFTLREVDREELEEEEEQEQEQVPGGEGRDS